MLDVFSNLDRLLTVEMRQQGKPTGAIAQLQQVARGDGDPLTYRASQALRELGGGTVGMITGVYFPPYLPKGEIDGPIGAAVLAGALVRLGFDAEILVEQEMMDVLEELVDELGQSNIRVVAGQSVTPAEIADRWDACVSIERLGRNAKGIRHSINGTPIDMAYKDPDEIVTLLTDAGKVTIGMGDGGNEIGFGAIYDQARPIVRHGADCGCPCGGGIVTSTATRYVLPVCVSNYGAYATAAGLGLLTGQPELAPDPDLVERLIRRAHAAGCLDGGTFNPDFIGDDGIPIEGVRAFVTLIRTIVRQWFTPCERHV